MADNSGDNENEKNNKDQSSESSRNLRAPSSVERTSKGGGALEVSLDHHMHIEKAMKILKRKLIKEGLFKELKLRRYYEKPSERKKRKHKESMKKLRKEESRLKKNPYLFN